MEHSPSPVPRADLRLAGALAMAVSLAAQWAASSVFPALAFAPALLAGAVIRFTPGDLATFMIEALGHWAMRLLTAIVLMGTLAAGGEALARTDHRHGPRPAVAAATLVVVGALVVIVAPSAGTSLPQSLLLLGIGGVIFWLTALRLLRLLAAGDRTDVARRRALASGAVGVLGLAFGGGVLGYVLRRLGGPSTQVALARPGRRASVPDRAGFPDAPGISDEVTSTADHYVVDINLVPPFVEAPGWTLTVKGHVDEEVELDFQQLQSRFELVEEYATLTCVSNEVGGHLIGHSLWTGARLSDVLNAAGVRAGAVDVVFRAADGYSDSIPLDVARDPAVILAVAQNRKPLTQEHGFPCRVRVPPIFGMKNVKWLQEIEVVGSDYRGYWQQRGWSDDATVKTQSRIDVAGEDLTARAGEQTWIAGVAWAGDRGISRVEVSTDGGATWQGAELREPIGPTSWQQWAYRWTPASAGTASVLCRATDGEGRVQTESAAPPHPAGATGYHGVVVEVG